MKKTLLALIFGGIIASGANAATVDYSYISDVENYWGYSKKETYDVAVFLPGEVFEGYTLTNISAQLNNSKGTSSYKDFSGFVTKNLTVTDKANNPDVGVYSGTMNDDCVINVPVEPYTITAEGVYVGYTFTIDLLNAASKYPVGVARCDDSNSFYVHASRSQAGSFKNIAAGDGYGCQLTVTVESDNMPARAVTISALSDPIRVQVGEDSVIPVVLASSGSQAVNSVDLEYVVDGTAYSKNFTLSEVVPAGLNQKFLVNVEIPAVDKEVVSTAKFTVAKVNGDSNEAKIASKEVTFVSLAALPIHQALFEEYTGTGCPWCPRGLAALEHIKKNYPEFVVAAYHHYNSSDPMYISSIPSNVTGYPAAVFDRAVIGDPYYGTEKYINNILPVIGDIEEINAIFTPWVINIEHTWDSDDLLTAKATIVNVDGYEGDYQLAYILVEDGLTGTGTKWAQGNNYAGYAQSSKQIEELNDFCKGGVYGVSSVSGLHYNDVVITTTGMKGVAGSLPAQAAPAKKIEHSLTFDLTKVKEELMQDKNKLRIIVAVLDGEGHSVNCAKHEVNDYTGAAVNVVNAAEGEVEYFNMNGTKVSNPSNGVFIRKQGDKTSKVILK